MTDISKLIIGSRASRLAMIQSRWVKAELERFYPELEVEIKEIQTQGDKILDTALSKIGDKGLFVKELENELLAGTVDLAVHSMKDLQTTLPEGLEIAVTSIREDVRDIICASKSNINKTIKDFKTIGTSSLRRVSQLRRKYPEIDFVDIRGNLSTRFRKLDEGQMDAIVLAAAGVKRMAADGEDYMDRIVEYLDPLEILPAVGQGALAIEIASNRTEVKTLLEKLNSAKDSQIVAGERSFLRTLEGGCQVPIGIYSEPNGEQIKYTGMIASLDGKEYIRSDISGALADSEALGIKLAEELVKAGGLEVLKALSRQN